jgi:hypothetical protein
MTTLTGRIGPCSRTRPVAGYIHRETWPCMHVLRRDRLGGLIHEYSQVA